MQTETLIVDEQKIDISHLKISRENLNGFHNALYHLDSQILAALMHAKNVGFTVQYTSESPMFFGFDTLPFQEGAAKLPGILGICR